MIEYYKSILSDSDIDQLSQHISEFSKHDTEVFHSLRAELNLPLFLKVIIYDKLELFSKKYNVDVGKIEFAKYRRYFPGDYIKLHHDNNKNANRKVTIIFGVSDQYEGGEFCIDGKEFKISKGDMLLFSSEIMHEVKEITKGMRDIVVVLTHTVST